MAEILLAPELQNVPAIRHGFYTKEWGDGGRGSVPDNATIDKNRAAIALSLGLSANRLLSAKQVHSPDVVTVTGPWSRLERPEADGMVTDKKGLALAVLTADCVPVLFVDPKAHVIGAAHAGWRGALTGVIENTVAAMEKCGAQRSSILAAIGPCIWQNSYEVGPEFPTPFIAEDPSYARFFRPSLNVGHYMFNLPAYAEAKLKAARILSITPSPADTCADPSRFYSYRYSFLKGQARAGNLISVIVLAD